MNYTGNQLDASIVRIYDKDGDVHGAGFRITERHLLTCAHVVARALDIRQVGKQEPVDEVIFDFPLVAAGAKFLARVVCWQPDIPELADIAIGERDIAVLELNGKPPPGSRPTQLVTTDNYWGHTFRACGFPAGHDGGVWASGFIRGRQANGWVQIEDNKEIGFFVEQGFSGTLVWDDQSDGVAGMIVGVEGSLKKRTAYMIPAPNLAKVSANFGQQILESNAQKELLTLESPGAEVDPKSPFYVARRSDLNALSIVKRQGSTTTIRGPGQMGKSTLLARMIQAGREMGKRAILINLQNFDQQALKDVNLFFRQFCSWMTDLLDLEDRVDRYWTPYLGNIHRVTRYIRDYLLRDFEAALVLAIDEVDTIFSAEFRKDFFGMLRSWHESRATNPIWKQLDIVLVTSNEPYHFIDDLNQSPFVGDIIEMEDFTVEEGHDLNKRHGSPCDRGELERLMKLVAGHPFLVRSALYQVASKQISINSLLANATADDGPFRQHLGFLYFNIHDKDNLVKGMRQVIRENTCQDQKVRVRLQNEGLVRVEGNSVKLRRPIYAEYFRRRLHA